ncbi:MAG: hypothetical protein JWQ91_3044 [Aeromicrobium sp.]|uniref:GAF domain-containing protein n=1 Tax=Aeromicrobium sp. TaxID=1871063 RepID=UPI0026023760|nr:GAF domain-containing protein [Aeromicrobium sp.]MCW2826127.1 hypothetical protein [Aeromicrobium sp.]
MSQEPLVHRAPMRSRSDDVDAGATVERALALGVVGVGALGREDEQDRLARRLERFATVPEGSFVWTVDVDGLAHVGRITGPLRTDPDGTAVDLVHVRPCEWHPSARVPAGVEATFARGGRNFQQVHAPGVGRQTQEIWAELTEGASTS